MTLPKEWKSNPKDKESEDQQQQELEESKRYAEFVEREKTGHYRFPDEMANYYYNVVKPAKENPATPKAEMDGCLVITAQCN